MEFLKKNKFAVIALFVTILLGSFIALKESVKKVEVAKPACVQAPQQELEIIGFFCAQSLNVPEFKKEVCLQIKGSEECVFDQSDEQAINELFLKKLKPCLNEALTGAGYCPFEIQ